MNRYGGTAARGIFAVGLVIGFVPGWATETDLSVFPSVLSVEMLGDDNGQRDFYLGLDLAVPESIRLQLEGGITQGGQNIEDTTSVLAGLSSDPGKDFVAGIYYQIRDQSGAFHIENIGVDLTLYHDEWMFSFAPRLRYITLYTSERIRRRRNINEFKLDSQGVEFGIGYFGFSGWGLTVHHRFVDYSEDLSRIERYPALAELFFAQGSLNLAWALDRSQTRFGATYYFIRFPLALGGRISSSSSAVDGSRYSTASAYADWDINAAWAVSVDAGSADSDAGYRSLFFRTAVRYQW